MRAFHTAYLPLLLIKNRYKKSNIKFVFNKSLFDIKNTKSRFLKLNKKLHQIHLKISNTLLDDANKLKISVSMFFLSFCFVTREYIIFRLDSNRIFIDYVLLAPLDPNLSSVMNILCVQSL